MKYVKIFPNIKLEQSEIFLNGFLKEIDKEGHRVLHTQYKVNDDTVTAVFTVTDQINR